MAALGHSAHPADPLLIACKDLVCLYGVTPVSLSVMTRAWDALIDDFPLSPSALEAFAVGRGQMFGAAVAIASCELTPLIASAGATYALTDFAFHCSIRITAQSALALAEKQMSTQQRLYWPKPMRPFRILSAFAAFDRKAGLDGPRAIGTPRRLWHLARTLI